MIHGIWLCSSCLVTSPGFSPRVLHWSEPLVFRCSAEVIAQPLTPHIPCCLDLKEVIISRDLTVTLSSSFCRSPFTISLFFFFLKSLKYLDSSARHEKDTCTEILMTSPFFQSTFTWNNIAWLLLCKIFNAFWSGISSFYSGSFSIHSKTRGHCEMERFNTSPF